MERKALEESLNLGASRLDFFPKWVYNIKSFFGYGMSQIWLKRGNLRKGAFMEIFLAVSLLLFVVCLFVQFFVTNGRQGEPIDQEVIDFRKINNYFPINGNYAIECAEKMANGIPIEVPPNCGQYIGSSFT